MGFPVKLEGGFSTPSLFSYRSCPIHCRMFNRSLASTHQIPKHPLPSCDTKNVPTAGKEDESIPPNILGNEHAKSKTLGRILASHLPDLPAQGAAAGTPTYLHQGLCQFWTRPNSKECTAALYSAVTQGLPYTGHFCDFCRVNSAVGWRESFRKTRCLQY